VIVFLKKIHYRFDVTRGKNQYLLFFPSTPSSRPESTRLVRAFAAATVLRDHVTGLVIYYNNFYVRLHAQPSIKERNASINNINAIKIILMGHHDVYWPFNDLQ